MTPPRDHERIDAAFAARERIDAVLIVFGGLLSDVRLRDGHASNMAIVAALFMCAPEFMYRLFVQMDLAPTEEERAEIRVLVEAAADRLRQ